MWDGRMIGRRKREEEEEKKEKKVKRTLARWPVPTIPTLPPAFSILPAIFNYVYLYTYACGVTSDL